MPQEDFWFLDPKFREYVETPDSDLSAKDKAAKRFLNTYKLRKEYGWEHSPLDSMEHEALARYLVNDDPKNWLPLLPLAIPAYAAKKNLGLKPGAETGGTLEQMIAGYKGWGGGLFDVISEKHPKEYVPDIIQRALVSPGYAIVKGILDLPDQFSFLKDVARQ